MGFWTQVCGRVPGHSEVPASLSTSLQSEPLTSCGANGVEIVSDVAVKLSWSPVEWTVHWTWCFRIKPEFLLRWCGI